MTKTLLDDPRVAEVLGGDLARTITTAFAQMEIAEEEIAKAGGKANPAIWNAFPLLRAEQHPIMGTAFVYRAHCAEILERVAAGADTRPATDAELACAISEMSQVASLTRPLVNLQMLIFARRFPEQYALLEFDALPLTDYDQAECDEWERKLRRRLRQDWRRPEKPAG